MPTGLPREVRRAAMMSFEAGRNPLNPGLAALIGELSTRNRIGAPGPPITVDPRVCGAAVVDHHRPILRTSPRRQCICARRPPAMSVVLFSKSTADWASDRPSADTEMHDRGGAETINVRIYGAADRRRCCAALFSKR